MFSFSFHDVCSSLGSIATFSDLCFKSSPFWLVDAVCDSFQTRLKVSRVLVCAAIRVLRWSTFCSDWQQGGPATVGGGADLGPGDGFTTRLPLEAFVPIEWNSLRSGGPLVQSVPRRRAKEKERARVISTNKTSRPRGEKYSLY